MPKPVKFALFGSVLLLVVLPAASCAPTMPARSGEMVVSAVPQHHAKLGRICVTVYGEDVGGLASHYYPLPREDFEAALLDSMAEGGAFEPVAADSAPDYRLTVGLISLTQPQWSGRVTLETSWTIVSAATGTELGRRSVVITAPASFSKKQQATAAAAQMTIAEGLAWLEGVVRSAPGT